MTAEQAFISAKMVRQRSRSLHRVTAFRPLQRAGPVDVLGPLLTLVPVTEIDSFV